MKAEHERVKAIFFQALELEGEARARLLREKCENDVALRNQVESLLRHHFDETLLTRAAQRDTLNQDIDPAAAKEKGIARGARSLTEGRLAASILGGRWRQIAIALAAIVLIALLGYETHRRIKKAIREMVGAQLRALLDAEVLALSHWIEHCKSDARGMAADARVLDAVEQLVEIGRRRDGARELLLETLAQAELAEIFDPFLHEDDGAAYSLIDRTGRILASNYSEGVGLRLNAAGSAYMVQVFRKESQFARPYREDVWILDPPEIVYGRPLTWIDTPVVNADGEVIASLGFGRYADHRFNQILSAARMGDSGEAYAFDEYGLMLSESRFIEQLREIGMVPDTPQATAILQIEVRDPGVDLTRGKRKRLPGVPDDPLTDIVLQATSSRDRESREDRRGVMLEPYRDYRGVEVIGAWEWLPKYALGVVAEVDVEEADRPLVYLRTLIELLVGMLAVSVTVGLLVSLTVVRLREKLGFAMQLGQYQLERLIGEGGMGKVYLAQHALLRRPTAVKIMRRDKGSAKNIKRFEREVQLACQLTHPNTIDIYDYGHTPNGVFYYAMEYLPGWTLAELIDLEKAVPAGRVVHILKQVCGSLGEAHAKGLVHRDIKPQNIMLCERGGVFDFVKVLDFGLVAHIGQSSPSRLTAKMQVIGTPLYMAPEQFRTPRDVDARTDIYALGAVAYQLLTGKPPFHSENPLDVVEQVLAAEPPRPSEVAPLPIPADLERVVLRCLAKDVDERFASVADLLDAVEGIRAVVPWRQADAQAWWQAQDQPTDEE